MRGGRFQKEDVIPVLIMIVAVGIFCWLVYFFVFIDSANAAQQPIPGKPETYTEKYQCPFYENVDAKGCVPPADLVCNADWSHCEPRKDEVEPTPEIAAPPAASHEVKKPATVVNCTES